jgi:hypothetical protein
MCALSTSTDRGHTWKTKQIAPLPAGAQGAVVATNPTGERLAVAAIMPHSAGAMREPVTVSVYGSDGSRQASGQSPAADSLTWVGSSLLGIGGVQRGVLASSVDGGQSWQARQTPEGSLPSGEIGPGAATYGNPVLPSADSAVIPAVRAAGNGNAVLVMLRTRDGITFDAVASMALKHEVAGGIAPVASLRGADVYIAIPGDRAAYLLSGKAITELAVDGAPAGLESLTFADARHGLAFASSANCATGKTACTNAAELKLTEDGGLTWKAATAPAFS